MTRPNDHPEWEDWFSQWGKYEVHAVYYCSRADFDVEDMYQMFKARMLAEVVAVRECQIIFSPDGSSESQSREELLLMESESCTTSVE